jgi:DNA-binding beta-propeller fold protein YncE
MRWPRLHVFALVGAGVLAACVLAACGARGRQGAEPANSPQLAIQPAGRSIRVGALPEGIAADSRRDLIAVATRDPNEIVVLAASTGRILWRVPLPGHARHLALAGPAGPVLIPAETANRLLELNLSSRRVASVPVGRLPHDAAAAAGRVFVTDEFGHRVSVLQRGRVVAQIAGFVQPGGITAVGPDVAVVDVGANTLTLIDATTLHRVAVANAGSGPTHAVADAAGHVYVVDTRGDAIEVFTTRPYLRLLSRYPLAGAPYGLAIDPVRRRLWVTLTATNELAELDISSASPRLVARYPTGRQPNTLAVNTTTGEVFVANSASATVEILQAPR